MAVYVLVHGAWHGGWCWSRVADLLKRDGHEVHSPCLTGLGSRGDLLSPGITLETHIQDIVSFVRCETTSPIVLCAHSYSGLAAAAATEQLGARVRRLAFIDAYLPTFGLSIFEASRPQFKKRMEDLASAQGDGWLVPPPHASAFGIRSRSDAAWIQNQLRPQPIATFSERCLIQGTWDKGRELLYLRSLPGNFDVVFENAFRYASQADNWSACRLDGGHDLMIDCPHTTYYCLKQFGESAT